MELMVQFRNRSGRWLRGMIHRPGEAARRRVPCVVFLHGFTGDRMESHWIFVKCARALAKQGIASLRFDFYGSGESEGEFREVTLQGEISDARVAVEFSRRQKGIDARRLGLCGLSLGGAVAACVASPLRVQVLVLWAALAHPTHLRDLSERASPIAGEHGAREYNAHRVSPRFLDHIEKFQPLQSIARFKNPTLIIHPEKDAYLSLVHPHDYFQAAGASLKEKIIIPGADHTFSSIAWESEAIARTVDWFRRSLSTRDARLS
jgi:alpha/beta superfamily hydrolase